MTQPDFSSLRSDYQIIYADPAWSYKDKCHSGGRGAEYNYRCTSTDEMCDWNVASICAPNCTLFMWVTMPMLPDGLKLMQEWGFKYKTVAFVWHKLTLNGKSAFGMGNWTRANAEMVMLGVRGRPKRINASVRQMIESMIGAHSVKPQEIRDRIVQLMGDIPRLEMFARSRADGWDTWGDSVGIQA